MRNKHVETGIVYSDATPRRVIYYVKELGHALKNYAEANNLPEIEAIATKLIWFMRFEESYESFSVTGRAKLHPSFEEYFSALMAQPHFKTLCGDAAASILKAEYTPKAHQFLPNGYSLWSMTFRKPYPSE